MCTILITVSGGFLGGEAGGGRIFKTNERMFPNTHDYIVM